VIEIIDGLPAGILGVRATGEVSAGEYDQVLVPALDNALAGDGKVRLLGQLGPGFEGVEANGMWLDGRFGVGQLRSFERMALVTDVDWVTRAVRAFSWMVPGQVKIFTNADFDDAVAWLAS
jgi:hypothetical protein